MTEEQRRLIDDTRAACVAERSGNVLSPIELADRESEIADWLVRHDSDPTHADRLAETEKQRHSLERATGRPGSA